MTSLQRRHRVLASITRSRLLAVLRQSRRPMGVRELADAVDLHANTVREHLDQLVEVGLAAREIAPPTGRGRPKLRYAAAPEAVDEDPQAYRTLARVLADELARLPDAAGASVDAGEHWGESIVTGTPPAADATGAVRRIVELLDDAGFAPETPTRPGEPIRLRHCPFGILARDRPDVVCGVHLGLMRGALRELGAPLDAVRLEPFVAPDLCIAHLGSRSDG
ncbi:MAG TPA: helix-turn-helix domain-containing protein [Candidatus Saccharimonadales bacterium]|nr:helix-turn-helix domain-containing protein [Candidatus Saccharimonadales bacterium]